MSNSLLGEEPGPPQPSIEEAFAKAAEKRKRMTYLAIPVTIGVGLLVAVIYIGGRMVSAKPHAAPPTVAASAPISVPPPPVPVEPAKVEPPKTEQVAPVEIKQARAATEQPQEVKKEVATVAKVTPPSSAPAPQQQKPVVHNNTPLTLITPRSGETYLQLAALGPRTVLRYLDELRAGDLEPCVAPGPTPDLLRVLVGPFPDSGSLSKAKARLDGAKIEWIIRAY